MLESFKNYNIKNVGEVVTLSGWVSKVRNLGGLVFIDLRNRTGIMQVVVRPENEYYSVGNGVMLSGNNLSDMRTVCDLNKILLNYSQDEAFSVSEITVMENDSILSITIATGKCIAYTAKERR